MKIAPQHIKGTPEYEVLRNFRTCPDYTPVKPWPDDAMVQWGHGMIPAVPFFEAFIPGTFIRGEGSDIAEAEARAFEQYQRETNCQHHWGRQGPRGDLYFNGSGWCRKCGAYRSKMFRPIVMFGQHRRPLSLIEMDHLISLESDEALNDYIDQKYPHEREERRKQRRLLELRRSLFGGFMRQASTSPE